MAQAAFKPEESTPDEGPASLRDALAAEFEAQESDEQESTDAPDEEKSELDETSEAEEAEPESSEDEEQESQDEEEVIQAPEHWSDEDKAVFVELPETAQNYLLKREQQYEKGIREKSEAAKPYQEALKPFEGMLKARGIDPVQAIQYWANAQMQIDANPEAALSALAKSYGLELSVPSKDTQTEDPDPFVDPEVKKLQKELDDLKSQNQSIQTQYQATSQQEAYAQIQNFAEAKDDQGNLKHPYFEQARGVMQGLIQTGVAADLETAYEQAVWSLPEFRDEYAKTQAEAAEEAARKKRETAAAKAKKTAKTVKGKNSAPKTEKKTRTLRDDLTEAYDLSSRGEL
ncbi:MAG: hypothetical protein KTR33_13900 [Gammaproteobacteria bacterium]|nr:hypothetical protein [Gammaproteobacteria bacterium]